MATRLKSYQLRNARLTIPLTAAETKKIERAARVLGLPKAIWGRVALLEKADKIIAEAKIASQ